MSAKSIVIGCSSGFWGDSAYAARQLVGSGRLNYLVSDYLSEITMSLLARARQKNPEQGYPARLLLPGWEGNINVKWIRRIEISDRPFMTREETSKYTDIIPREGKARQFTFEWDAKSMIIYPSGGMTLPGRGFIEISGLAWSGRGKVARVEVSADGGRTWGLATLQEPILPKTSTRFRYPWMWDGQEAVILSRCTDELGYIQPTRNQLLAARGSSTYHFNGIQAWKIRADGKVVHAYHETPLKTEIPALLAGPWPLVPDCGLV